MEQSKRLCLERDANRCMTCGTNVGLEVCQLVERPEAVFWHLSNLVTLCGGCRKESDIIKKNPYPNRVGVVCCGGRGSRIFPITAYLNKHVIPIGLLPMVFYPLKTLRALGVKRVLVVVDRQGADDLVKMLGSGKAFGMDISYKIQEGASGISGALSLAEDFARPGDQIFCILGDNIFDNEGLNKQVDLGESRACVFVKEVAEPGAYGVAQIEDGKVVKIIEKPKEFVSNLAVVGLYIYTYEVFGVIKNIKPSERGELEISSVNDYFAARGQLKHARVEKFWGDAGGSIQNYAQCNLMGAKQANVSAQEIENFKAVVFDDR